MGTIKILGTEVDVQKREIPLTSEFTDVEYTITGTGAKKLHQICSHYVANPSDFQNGAFTIKKSDVTDYASFGDTPTHQTLAKGFAEATTEREQYSKAAYIEQIRSDSQNVARATLYEMHALAKLLITTHPTARAFLPRPAHLAKFTFDGDEEVFLNQAYKDLYPHFKATNPGRSENLIAGRILEADGISLVRELSRGLGR